MMWGIENTCDAVWAQKREKFSKEGLGLEEVKRPDKKVRTTTQLWHDCILFAIFDCINVSALVVTDCECLPYSTFIDS